jgi:MFS family permease
MVYVVSLIPFVAFDAAVCGAGSLNALLMFRFCAGTFGCSTMTNAGGIISDMFEADQRGLAMGVFGACQAHLKLVI